MNKNIPDEKRERERESEYIKFNVDGKVIPIPVVTAFESQYVGVLTDNFGTDVIIDIPDKFLSVIDNYINFLRGKEDDINNPDQYKPCFDMYTYFDDSEYLDYLISQTLKHWPIVSNIVYDKLIPELQWQIFLYSSYQVIPQRYLTDTKFYLEWAKFKTDVIYEDSNSGHYYNNILMGNGMRGTNVVYESWHGIRASNSGDEYALGYGLEVGFYSQGGNIMYICETDNGESMTGKFIKYYDNNQHTVKSISHYHDSSKNGTVTAWYNNPQYTIRKKGNYINSRKDGIWEYWYDPTTTTFGNHTLDKLMLEKRGKYVGGNKEGLWRYWHNDIGHSLAEKGEYYHDRKIGIWRSWYPINENGEHIVKDQGNYIYDKDLIDVNEQHDIYDVDIKDGLWTQYDTNGNVISTDTYVNGQLQ